MNTVLTMNETVVTEDSLQAQFDKLNVAYNKSPDPSYQQRIDLIKQIKKTLIANERNIYDALNQDYGQRSEFDTFVADVLPSIEIINYTLKHLKKWMKPSKRHAGMLLRPASVKVHYQPLGMVGIITPWNFPFFLSLGPAIQAIAAGNRVMIKMSELTPHANKVLKTIFEEITQHIIIIEGGPDTGKAFSELPFDHLLFTGSTMVGKLVAQAAAKNLTPVTLELGGKSPTIIDKSANMAIAVDSIIMGKSVNSGQICVSPDYILIHKDRKKEFIDTFITRYQEYHLNDKNKQTQTHIISDKQYNRLIGFLQDAKAKGAEIESVGESTQQSRLLYPHLLTNVTDEMDVMQEEIFGSLLPIVTFDKIEQAIDYINARQRPLALYIMSSDKKVIQQVLAKTHSGGVSINATTAQVMADDAPFGGIGASGMGHYHGHEGFLTFSKAKTVVHAPSWLPKNRFILKNRQWVFRRLRKLFLK